MNSQRIKNFYKKKQKRMCHIVDEELGELKYANSFWTGKCDFSLYHKKESVNLSFEDDDKDGITQKQRESFRWIKENQFREALEEDILSYYQYLLEEQKDTFDEDYLEKLPEVTTKEDLSKLVKPKEIMIKHDEAMHLILTFACKWNKDLGMAVNIENCEVVEIGYEPDIL